MSKPERPRMIPIQEQWDNVIATDVPPDMASGDSERLYAMVNPEEFPLIPHFSVDSDSPLPSKTDVKYTSIATLKGLVYVGAGKIVSEITTGTFMDYAALAAGVGLGVYMGGAEYDRLHEADYEEQVAAFNAAVRDGVVVSSERANYILDPAHSDELRARQLVVSDEGIEVSASDVVAWIEQSSSDRSPFYINTHSNQMGVQANAPAAVARMDTSLYAEYASNQEDLGVDDGLSENDKLLERTTRFMRHAEEYASSLGVQLQPSRLRLTTTPQRTGILGRMTDAIERNANELLGRVSERGGWRDVEFSLISIKPDELLTDQLQNDPQPGLVFAQTRSSLDELQRIQAECRELAKRVAALSEIGELTRTQSAVHAAETSSLQSDLNGLFIDEAAAALAFAGTLIVRKRQLAFKQQQQELLEDMSESSDYPDQEGALDLYDIAVSALATRADPTDSQAMADNKDITKYLADASRLSDGTDETRRRLYNGLREQFPALKLPDYSGS